MAVELKPVATIEARLGIDANGRVQKQFSEICYQRMDKYVPKSENGGVLRETVNIQPDSITYEVPYAHAQYVGFTRGPVVHYTTPGTGPYWAERMKSAEMPEVLKEIADYIIKGGKS